MKSIGCLLTKWVLSHFPLIFNKKTWNDTFIYRKKNKSKFQRYIKVGHTIYKLYDSLGLYWCCIFDYSHLYNILLSVRLNNVKYPVVR